VVIEILGAIAADAAGESMHKNKEKKKLEDPKRIIYFNVAIIAIVLIISSS